jgi:hypothetical protein
MLESSGLPAWLENTIQSCACHVAKAGDTQSWLLMQLDTIKRAHRSESGGEKIRICSSPTIMRRLRNESIISASLSWNIVHQKIAQSYVVDHSSEVISLERTSLSSRKEESSCVVQGRKCVCVPSLFGQRPRSP